MKIEKVLIKNFYSFKDVVFNLEDYTGLTVLEGINLDAGGSSGGGKSILIEAIYYGLTGKTIRKSTEATMVNNQAKKKLEVEIHLTHKGQKVIIKRGKKPTKLEFHVEGDNEIQANVRNTQAAIDEFLNTNYKVMLSSMFFGQSNDLNFLDCNAEDKRTVIRNFLNVGDLFDMRDKIKAIKSEHWQSMKTIDAVVVESEKHIISLEGKIYDFNELKKDYAEFSGIPEDSTLEGILEVEKHNRNVVSMTRAYTNDLEVSKARYAKAKAKLDDGILDYECGECGQRAPYDIPSTKRTVAGFKADISRTNTLLRSVGSKRDVLLSSAEFSKYLKYRDLCNTSNNFSELKSELQETVTEKMKEKSGHKLDYEVMRFWEKAFSEQGIIKYIIKNVLEYFNERCNYYLSYLTNSKYSIQFDEELGEKIETNGSLVAYISLSGGEKRKTNLAVTLGLKDLLLLTDKSHASLIFFDEVTEGIDPEGIQGLYDLLLEIKKTKTVFIITHNKHLKTLLDSAKRVTIIKDKGTSTILKTKHGKSNTK